MVQMVGLGGGEQDAVDSRPKQTAEQRAAPDPETIQDSGQRRLEVVQRFRSGVERRQRIDQNDLAIKPREMIAKEGTNHDVLIGLVTPAHHRPQRPVGRDPVDGSCSGANVSAGEPARLPGIRKRPGAAGSWRSVRRGRHANIR